MRRGLAVYTQIFEVVGHLWDCLKKWKYRGTVEKSGFYNFSLLSMFLKSEKTLIYNRTFIMKFVLFLYFSSCDFFLTVGFSCSA